MRSDGSWLGFGAVAYVVMVGGMIATPLFARGGDERVALALVVVGALFVAALSASVHMHGCGAFVAATLIVAVTFGLEVLGSSTGFPFGSYEYSEKLRPQLFDVPIIVAFAWAGITLTVHAAFSALHVAGRRLAAVPSVIVMALAITAWDAFLDPQMVAEGYWAWEPTTPSYRGIPLVNYLGWLLTAGITSTITVLVCRQRHRSTVLPSVVYATLAVLSTIGFVAFFDDLVVAMVGGVAMGIFAVLAVRVARART
jgi:uncharacterized membrane protein